MRARRAIRIVGTVMTVVGVAVLVWVIVVWRWQDPFTALYTHWKQHQLARSYDHLYAAYRPATFGPSTASLAAIERTIAREARLYRRDADRGQAIGRIKVPRLGLNMILVNGTDHDSLTKGPGRDLVTYMPGQGKLVYIAGHRTTYLAPFAHIERLRFGDFVMLEVPYGTFRYRVYKERIVRADDLSVLHTPTQGGEIVELQACHPRFFASHRYIAYGRLVRVEPRGGQAFTPPTNALAAPPGVSAKS
jgi:sortase A